MNAEEITDFVGWLSSHRQGPAPGQSIPPGSDCCQHANLTLEPAMTSHEPDHPPLSPEAKNYSTRRDFLLHVGTVINAIAAFMIGVPIIGFIVSSVIKKTPRVWISLGPVSKFPEGANRLAAYKTPYSREVDGETAILTCWVRRLEGDKFRIFASNCTHLGCPVRWFEQSQLFLCPCHGGAFYADGEHAAGPPPRALYEYEYKVENGELMVKGGILPTLANPGLNQA